MNEEQEKNRPVSSERNDIEVTNPQRQGGALPPDRRPDPGDERRADLTTEANREIAESHGDERKDGDKTTRLEQLEDPAGSIDEHMPAGSESAEDKANDIINSGILRI